MPPKSYSKSASKTGKSYSNYSSKSAPDNTAYKALREAVQNKQVGTLYFFHGEEPYLQEYYLRQIRKMLLPEGLEEFNHRTARADTCSLEWLEQAIDSLPVMSERTLVEVEDWDPFSLNKKDMPRFLKLVEDIPEYCCLIFVYDTIPWKGDSRTKLGALLKDRNANVSFNKQEQSDLIAFIAREFKRTKHTITNEDARYLIFRCGNEMSNLAGEVAKLSAYCTQPQITQADIDFITVPVMEAVVFQITDAIAARDFDKAANAMSDLLYSSEDPYKIIAVIGKYFRQLYSARLCQDHYESMQTFMQLWGMKNSYPAEKLFAAAKKFRINWCRYALRRCAEISIDFRDNYGEEIDLLTGLMMELSTGIQAVD